MKINFFDIDEYCKTLEPVITNKIYSKKGFHPNGLFSEKIFGPTRTCTCSCGIYWGRSKLGQVCSVCGVKIAFSSMRRTSFGKIELPFPVMNPIMFYLIERIGKVTVSKIISELIFDETLAGYYFCAKSKRYVRVDKPTIETSNFTDNANQASSSTATPPPPAPDLRTLLNLPEGVILYSGYKGAHELIKFESERNKETSLSWKFINQNVNKFFIKNIIVCPPEFRPVSKTKDVQMRDKMNEYYMTILNASIMLKDDVSTYQNSEIQMINFRNLQRHVFSFYEYVFSKFSKKTGLIRGSILGKRIDFSARAVICPDPQLTLDYCSLPYVMILELFKLDIVNRLLEMKNFQDQKFIRYDPTINFVDECIRDENLVLLDVANEIVKDRTVILNRQPTLHRMGFLAFKIKINTDHVIKIHPLVCEPYNADFDGDQMAAYINLNPKTEAECKDKIFVLANLLSPSTGKLIFGVNQDILLGLYLLTKPDETKKVTHLGVETYQGRIKFNSIFPTGFPFWNRTVTKKELNVFLNVIAKLFDANTVAKILDDMKTLGLEETTRRGTTFSLKNLRGDNAYESVSRIVDDTTKPLKEKFFELQDNPLKKQLQESFPYADFIESGSRGSWDQANQLVYCRGYISNSRGEVVPTPIKNNLVKGLSREEFFISCYGSRKALLDVALNTAVSGYLTRKLVYCTINLELGDIEDCGNEDLLELQCPPFHTQQQIEDLTKDVQDVKEREIRIKVLKSDNDEAIKFMKSLIGRWYHDPVSKDLKLVTDDNYLSFLSKKIKIRSPIFCKAPGVCKKCYGESWKVHHSKYVGVTAAQALGEVATQLTLRTFHVGGIAQMSQSQEDTSQKDIINDLGIVNKLLHGSLQVPYKDLLMRLFSIYSKHRILLLVHFEVVVSQMMRVGNSRWRLHPNRNDVEHQLVSIENVPSKESFLLALAFSKPYNYIVSGILGTSKNTDGILERMLVNKV